MRPIDIRRQDLWVDYDRAHQTTGALVDAPEVR